MKTPSQKPAGSSKDAVAFVVEEHRGVGELIPIVWAHMLMQAWVWAFWAMQPPTPFLASIILA
jgi:hypothetical protein